MLKYDRRAAVVYAHRYAFLPNPAYYNFDKLGGDCTNFISQCLYAGYPEMNYSQYGWYYKNAGNRSASWTGVEFLREFLVWAGERRGPRAKEIELSAALPGDIIQLSFDGERFTHTVIVVETGERGVLIAAHSDAADYRDINSYAFKRLSALHIH